MSERITKIQIGRTLFTVTEEFSPSATETVEQKLKKLIAQHAFDHSKVIRELSVSGGDQLAVCEESSEHGQYQTKTGGSSDEEETS